jgi:hypothetical protein
MKTVLSTLSLDAQATFAEIVSILGGAAAILVTDEVRERFATLEADLDELEAAGLLVLSDPEWPTLAESYLVLDSVLVLSKRGRDLASFVRDGGDHCPVGVAELGPESLSDEEEEATEGYARHLEALAHVCEDDGSYGCDGCNARVCSDCRVVYDREEGIAFCPGCHAENEAAKEERAANAEAETAIEDEAKRLIDANEVETGWLLRGLLDASLGRDPEQVPPGYRSDYFRGYERGAGLPLVVDALIDRAKELA